jgi:MinD superfamily P-loop ATPase
MIISVASGKGGTGKTTVAASLSCVIENSVYIDCDVEEPNGHILLKPKFEKITPSTKNMPLIDVTKCSLCGKCVEVCEFNALIDLKTEIMLIKEMCHGCDACRYFCPEKAISNDPHIIGKIREGKTEDLNKVFCDGILNIGEETAAPLINDVKKNIRKERINIIDSPPGTSCSMMESVKDSDYCILVTESSPFGLHDLELAVDVLKTLEVSFGVVINKYDKSFVELEEYLNRQKIPLLLKIPFDREIAKNYSTGIIPVQSSDNLLQKFEQLADNIIKKCTAQKQHLITGEEDGKHG